MRAPLLAPGLLLVLAVWLWPLWQPSAVACAAGAALCIALGVLADRCAALAIGCAAFLLGCAAPGFIPAGPSLQEDVEVEGVVVSTSGRRADLSLSAVGGVPTRGRVRLQFRERPPPVGSDLHAFGRGQSPWKSALPGAPDPAHEAAAARIDAVVKVRFHESNANTRRCEVFTDSRHEGLLRALACGDRAQIDEATDALLTRTGTRHLLAVSGLHVGAVAVAAYTLSWALLRPLALLWRRGRLRWLPSLIAVVGAWGFAWLSGWSVSSQRAAVMTTMVTLANASDRVSLTWNQWGLAAGLVALLSPASVRGVSFQLSFGAVAGMLLVVPRFTRLIPPDTPRPLVWLVKSVAATVGATLGTLPIAAWVFQQLPLLSPLTNLLAMPSAGVIVPLAVLTRAGLPLLPLAELGLDVLLTTLQVLDGHWPGLFPAAPVVHPAVGPLGVLALFAAVLSVRRPVVSLSLFVMALGLRSRPPDDELRVSFLSVGQGDAALVERGDWRLLVDGGPGSTDVVRYLRRRGLRHLDAVALSHPHPDHARGLTEVLATLQVDALWLPRRPLPHERDFLALWQLAHQRGVTIRLPGDPELDTLLPTPVLLAVTDSDPNEGSLVFTLRHGDTSVLFSGDLEREGEAMLLPLAEPISWLKVAHHGSRTSSEPALISRLAPRAAIISCGRDNHYGHPAPEVLTRFHPARVFRTDRDGTVQLRSDGQRESWRTWSPGEGWSDWIPLPERRASPLPPVPLLQPPATLAEAAYRGTRPDVLHFLSQGADLSARTRAGDTPLSLAIEGGHLDTAQLLRALGAPLSDGPRPPLCDAARYARIDVLAWLLDQGLSPDSPCRDGSPLHMATRARGHDTDALQLLLSAGATPTLLDRAGRSPAELARALNKPLRADLLRQDNETHD